MLKTSFTFYRQDLSSGCLISSSVTLDEPLNFNKIQDSHWRNNRKMALYLVGQLCKLNEILWARLLIKGKAHNSESSGDRDAHTLLFPPPVKPSSKL